VLASLALRDLTLVESLLRLVEQAEAREENPEQLAFLYQIDHLATRMRRHGENLLVLAGHDTHNSQFEPVPLLDVVRAAISETTDYDRVQIGSMPNVRVAGLAADDASHLLAELLDNAATKSPRHAPILVSGHPGDGSVVVVVEDSGIGVPTDRLEELNARLDGPPVLDASVTRHMGLYVVSRLAHRHGIRVRMEARVGGGTVVYIAVPDRLTQPNPPTPARPSQAPATPRTPAGEPAGTSPPPAPRPSPPAAPSERQPATTAGGLPRRVPRSTLPQRATPISAPPPPAAATPPGSGSPSSAPVEDAPADRLGADAARRIHDELDAFQTGQNAALRDVAASGGREDDQPEQ
jgi:hypothetical protein